MKFWSTLRRMAGVLFLLIVLACWLLSEREVPAAGSAAKEAQPAPPLVR
jgi:hypothetical protein